ncbi:MAG: hypothetical protein UX19_C0006G0013 [Candidatus Woesebacteria bacterium GW2011_GWA1_45_8]|uniref:Uncharacterized protein n=1 Tax=Candidatus Woesebacteria bacterium GW2011_GWA1_45_8 TaxID=1618559 RepID=A0A0G1MVF4_9BACT|nr:MAG: hypothetical protein UX19_C0006G0013 [Candidatus Woesebacteria bacterium GW2011_GWA1_45_8]
MARATSFLEGLEEVEGRKETKQCLGQVRRSSGVSIREILPLEETVDTSVLEESQMSAVPVRRRSAGASFGQA